MRKCKLAVLALVLALLLPTAAALSEEEMVEATIQQYFAITEQEDIDALLDIMVVPGEEEDSREIVEALWNLFDSKDIELSSFATEITSDGSTASSVFYLEGILVDEETGDEYPIGNDYIAVLQKVNGQWKLEAAMPLDEFVKHTRDAFLVAQGASDLAEEEYQKQKAAGGSGDVNGTGGGGTAGDGIDIIFLIFIAVAVIAFFAWKKFKGKGINKG